MKYISVRATRRETWWFEKGIESKMHAMNTYIVKETKFSLKALVSFLIGMWMTTYWQLHYDGISSNRIHISAILFCSHIFATLEFGIGICMVWSTICCHASILVETLLCQNLANLTRPNWTPNIKKNVCVQWYQSSHLNNSTLVLFRKPENLTVHQPAHISGIPTCYLTA